MNDIITGQLEVRSKYNAPLEIRIDDIPTIVVDSHNEVFGYWFNQFYGREPAILLHFDAHEDDCVSTGNERGEMRKDGLEFMQNVKTGDYPHQYAKEKLDCGSFIAPAAFYKIISNIYWIRDNRIKNITETIRDDLSVGIIWNGKKGIVRKFKERTEYSGMDYFVINSGRPIILDIDLDVFGSKNEWKKQLNDYEGLLNKLPRPSLITIARSQTPNAYVSPENVDLIQEEVLQRLNKLYSN